MFVYQRRPYPICFVSQTAWYFCVLYFQDVCVNEVWFKLQWNPVRKYARRLNCIVTIHTQHSTAQMKAKIPTTIADDKTMTRKIAYIRKIIETKRKGKGRVEWVNETKCFSRSIYEILWWAATATVLKLMVVIVVLPIFSRSL